MTRSTCLWIITSCSAETRFKLMKTLRGRWTGKIASRCFTNWWTISGTMLVLKITTLGSNSNLIWLGRSKIYTNTKICLMRWQHCSTLTTVLRISELCFRIGELHLLTLRSLKKLRQRYQLLILISLTRDKLKKLCCSRKPYRRRSKSKRLLMKHLQVKCQRILMR
jgi:hypothetical protein